MSTRRLPLTIIYADGTEVEVSAGASDFIRFERQYDRPFFVDGEDRRVEHMIWLGWAALRRSRPETADFDSWMDSVDGVTPTDTGADAVPLDSTTSTTSTSPTATG